MNFKTLRLILRHPLSGRNKQATLMRYIRWNLGSLLLRSTVVHDWVQGVKFYVRTNESGVLGDLYTGLFEFSEMAYLLHVLRKDDVFYDVGANVGAYSLLACGVVGCKGYAFEPVPSTYVRLVENVRLNHLEQRCICVNKGIGAEEGRIRFSSDSDTTNHALAEGEESTSAIDVDVVPLDALDFEVPALMKIDVEGYETLVLQGAKGVLGSPALHSVIMEMNGSGRHYGFNDSDILKRMQEHGFRTYSYDPYSRRLTALEGCNPESGNTIFIRDLTRVAPLLVGAEKIRALGQAF